MAQRRARGELLRQQNPGRMEAAAATDGEVLTAGVQGKDDQGLTAGWSGNGKEQRDVKKDRKEKKNMLQ